MAHLLFKLFGAVLLVATLPLVLELTLVTAANLLPAAKPNSKRKGWDPDFGAGNQESRPDETSVPFALAILVPAHNEELLVSRCVASLRASSDFAGSAVRVFVVAHNCVDSTAIRAEEAGAQVLAFNDATAVGKGFALRHGFEYALAHGAEAVMVVDADSIVSPNAVGAVLAAVGPGGYARVAQCRYEMQSTTDKSSTRLAALAFRGFNVIRPRGRERLGFSAGILGNGFAIVSPILRAIPYDAFSVVEDLEYHLHLVMAGERVRYLDEAVISADFPESRSAESVQRSRWVGGRVQTARTWALPLMGKVLKGRLRLFEPLCDLTGLPLAFGVFALLLALCVPLPWLRWYSGVSLGIVLAHVLTAAWAGPDFFKTLQLLLMVPFYILRKLWMIPAVLRGSSAKAAWVRTERNNTL
jgi:cellulose synthase/poly-beta-1,6-N-acetylglucosamine synthase-like glycosyltransferase